MERSEDQLKQQRAAYKGQLTSFKTWLRTVDVHKITLNFVDLKVNQLAKTFNNYDDVQFQIEQIDSNQCKDRTEFENGYQKTLCEVDNLIQKLRALEPPQLPSPQLNQSIGSQDKADETVSAPPRLLLPSVKIPKFSGNLETWQTFHEIFSSVIDKNDSIPLVQKHHFLRAYLEGPAARLLECIPITAADYTNALQLLTAKYDQPKVALKKHVKNLFDLDSVRYENPKHLERLLDGAQQNANALEARGMPVNQWDLLLVELIVSKLDNTTMRSWETETTEELCPSFKDLCTFLQKKINMLYALSKVQDRPSSGTKAKQPYRQKAFAVTSNEYTNSHEINCGLCDSNHFLYKCKKFHSLSVDERRKAVQDLKRCFNCLSPFHTVLNCRTSKHCARCNLKHHTSLHRPEIKRKNEGSPSRASTSNTENNKVESYLHNSTNKGETQILLSTCSVLVKSGSGKWIPTRILLDNASTHDFVTYNLVKRLGIPLKHTGVKVVGIGQCETEALKYAEVSIKDNIQRNFHMTLDCLVMNNISSNIPCSSFSNENWNIPEGMTLADAKYNESSPVHMLLSANSFWRIFIGGKIKLAPGVFARNTHLGWIITGRMTLPKQAYKQYCMFTNTKVNPEIEIFRDSYNLNEEVNELVTNEEEYCERLYEATTIRNEQGRFLVKMPFKNEQIPKLNSKQQVLGLFHCIENRLSKDAILREQYTDFLEQYEALGHMSVTKFNAEPHTAEVYLSHHPVWKDVENKGKIRVVFNASLPDNQGKSLNDFLYTGPALQNNLFDVLLNFRLHKVAVIGDLTQMYNQILLHPEQRSLQKIFWRLSPNHALKVFELNTLAFGVKCSSYLAIRTLHELAKRDGHLFHESAAHSLIECFYVDDFLQSFKSTQEAKETVRNLKDLLKGGGFSLSKICSNSLEFLQNIPKQERHLQLAEIEGGDQIVKTLGLHWNPFTDAFHYEYRKRENMELTKRNILSVIASIFDPISFVAPVVVTAKMLMQQLWLLKCQWDEVVPVDFQQTWRKYESTLKDLSYIVVPRQVCEKTILLDPELHIFADASMKAYGCCAYLVSRKENATQSSLICSKSKVAPLKSISLPRLELCAAVLAVQLKMHLLRYLKVRIKSSHLWSDSQVVLAWTTQPEKKWLTFVENRVKVIRQNSRTEEWGYVPSKQNPADLVSRGCTPLKLVDSQLYWNGPDWLVQPSKEWPKTEPNSDCNIPDERKIAKVHVSSVNQNPFYEKFSKFNTLVKVTAYILRWKKKVLEHLVVESEELTLQEIKQATHRLIILAQGQHFKKEIEMLTAGNSVDKGSPLYVLNPFVDEGGTLRVGGRLAQSSFSFEKRFPIILPYKEHISNLIIERLHVRNLHAGPRSLLYIVREQYWPIKALHTIKAIIKNCLACYKLKPKSPIQIMGDLPEVRTSPQRPFNTVGIDYTGSFLLKNPVTKAYVILFICMITGAIHLEVVSNSNSAFFLGALERFISRRGVPSQVISDNAPNLTKVQKIFNCQLQKGHRKILNAFCNENCITWRHLPPYSPVMGGRWEAQMKVFKKHLKATIGNSSLSYEHFNSLIIRIEGIMNSRPLSPLSSDAQDLLPLTPSHFLIGKSVTVTPSENLCLREMNSVNNLKLIKNKENTFWVRWKKEYLGNLQQRYMWKEASPNLKIGDLVLLKEATPPLIWSMGRVVKLYIGKDNKCRVVDVLSRKGIQRRHISKICALPMVNNIQEDA